MKLKSVNLVVLALSALSTLFSYIASGDGLGLCVGAVDYRNCISSVNNISEPLFCGFLPLLAISLILLFLRREIFMVWAKFAAVGFPLMLAILLYTYNNKPTSGGFGLAGLISDEMLATVFLPALFFIISLVVIIVKSRKLRKSFSPQV